jgi:4-aminobutyrate aminotransferase-like enzyme
MNRNDKIRERERRLGKAYRLFYGEPLEIIRGEGVWLYDAQGRKYLDCYNNVPHVGHCHARVVDALCEQARTLNTHTRYLHDNVLNLSRRLGKRLPGALDVTMFACTGSEANDLALRIARAKTGGTGVVVTEHAYHGNSRDIAALSPAYPNFEGLGEHVRTVPAPDLFRGAFRGADAGAQYAHLIREAFADLQSNGHAPAALLIDSMLASDGSPTPPADFLPLAAEAAREAGALYVADEVQPGFGRTGVAMWGFERYGVQPDIVTLGKPMGNGHPVSAMITSPDVIEPFAETTKYFNTFGGNPVSCAVALAVLDVLEEEQLMENAKRVGEQLQKGLSAIQAEDERIADVRGSGLFIAVELLRNGEPDLENTGRIVEKMREQGVLIGAASRDGNVLKIRPPMPFNTANADQFLETFRSVLKAL